MSAPEPRAASPAPVTATGMATGTAPGASAGALPGDVPGSTVARHLPPARGEGIGPAAARWLERGIIATCVVAILMIFQPFSLTLFSYGCGLVVFGALAFNLVPFCRADVSWRQIGRVVAIVLIVLAVAAALGIATAWLYVDNLSRLA